MEACSGLLGCHLHLRKHLALLGGRVCHVTLLESLPKLLDQRALVFLISVFLKL